MAFVPLVDQEISEANAEWLRLKEAARVHTAVFYGSAFWCAVGTPLVTLQTWRTEAPLVRTAIIWLGLGVAGFAAAYAARLWMGRLLRNLQSRVLRLQKAGFTVYRWRRDFRDACDMLIAATEKPDGNVSPLDLESISAFQLAVGACWKVRS